MFRPFLAAFTILAAATLAPLQAQPNNLFVGPSSLTFNASLGGIPTNTQTLSASSTTTPIALNVTVDIIGTSVSWLKVSATSGVTPFNLSVYADPTGLAAGTYQGRVNFTGSFGTTVFVNFVVSGGSGATTLAAGASSITQAASATGGVVTSQFGLSSTNPNIQVGFSIATSTTSGGNWLTVLPSTGITPSTITVSMDPTGLFSQTYSGSIVITPTAGGATITIPVTLNVNGVSSGFTLSTSNIPVNYQVGTSYPAQQSIYVSYSGGSIGYTATSSQSWALLSTSINPSAASSVSGTSGAPLLVSINPSGLSTGAYTSYITVTPSIGSPLTATVTLNISTSGFFVPNPNSLSFSYIPGSTPPVSQNVTVTSSTGASINFSATATSNGNWLTLSPNYGNTTTTNLLTVGIAQVTLTPGTYSGNIALIDSVSGVTTNIPVTLNYGVSGGTNQLNITPSSMFFQTPVGGGPVNQTLQIAAYSGASQNFHVAATSSTNWLSVAPGVGVTPSTITVVASASLVPGAGTYTGSVVFTNFDGTQQSVPVSFNVTSNVNLAASQNSLAFTQATGTPAPSGQTIQITSANGPSTPFSATSNSAWLTVAQNGASTPGSITVSVSAAGLSPATYSGQVSINGGLNQLLIPVSFTVLPANSITLNTTSINFNYVAGTQVPTPQVINVTTTSGSVPFNSIAAASIGGNWLSISQSANATPATLTVSINPAGLATGVYPGSITITTADGSGQKLTINVNLTVTAPPAPQISKVLHAASMQPTWLSPGLIMVIQGIGLGPQTVTGGTLLAPGAVDTIAGGTRVLFDGIPAPILSTQANAILTVVPYEVRGKSTSNMVVEYQGIQSAPNTLSVFDSAPGIFTRDGSGGGQASAVNENGSLNSPANPASPGSVVAIFASGEGATQPGGQDGRLIVTDVRLPLLPVRFYLNGRQLETLYAGSAPGFIAGSFQVNVRIPTDLTVTGSLPIELQVGTRASQANVTIAIQ